MLGMAQVLVSLSMHLRGRPVILAEKRAGLAEHLGTHCSCAWIVPGPSMLVTHAAHSGCIQSECSVAQWCKHTAVARWHVDDQLSCDRGTQWLSWRACAHVLSVQMARKYWCGNGAG
jgi:hypothetical protein